MATVRAPGPSNGIRSCGAAGTSRRATQAPPAAACQSAATARFGSVSSVPSAASNTVIAAIRPGVSRDNQDGDRHPDCRATEATAPRVSAAFRDRLRSGLEATLGDPEQPPSKDDDPPKDRDAAAPDEASRTGTARAMSYRMFASMADFGVLWLYLGNAVTASTLATLEFAAQGATSATHEYVWSLLAPSLAQNDLPGVGVETPLPR